MGVYERIVKYDGHPPEALGGSKQRRESEANQQRELIGRSCREFLESYGTIDARQRHLLIHAPLDGSRVSWRNRARDLRAARLFRNFEIIIRLQVHPELCGHSKEARKAERRVRGDRAVPIYDLENARRGYAEVRRKSVRRQADWLHRIFEEHFARVYGR
jgi:hypothetical protein